MRKSRLRETYSRINNVWIQHQLGLFGCKQNKINWLSSSKKGGGAYLEGYGTAHRMNTKLEKTGREPERQGRLHPVVQKVWTIFFFSIFLSLCSKFKVHGKRFQLIFNFRRRAGHVIYYLIKQLHAVKEVIPQKELSMQFWRVEWMLGGKEKKNSVVTSLVHCANLPSRKTIAPAVVLLLGHSLQLSAFQELPWLQRATLSIVIPFLGQATSLKLGCLRPGHFSLLLGQFSRDIFTPELPLGLIEAVSEPTAQLNFSLYPRLLSTSPFHRFWCQ